MNFQIRALPAEPFARFFTMDRAALTAHKARLIQVGQEQEGAFPCRVSLQHATPGETCVLVNYLHQPGCSPYYAAHAVFVRRDAQHYTPAPNEIPGIISQRLMAVRAFDANHMISDADVLEGTEIAPVIRAFFQNPGVAYIHLHNAKHGCFAALVNRA